MSQPDSVFTVDLKQTVQLGQDVHRGQAVRQPNHLSYDLALVELEDDGRLRDPAQLRDMEAAITAARRYPNGAIVVTFIHGWHHDGKWDIASDAGDEHFRGFRQVLRFLALREAERYFGGAGGRRVLGVYVAWNGDPRGSWLAGKPIATHLSFWDRYAVAKDIGEGDQLRTLVRTVVQRTKDRLQPPGAPEVESPLILIGHSMGGLMLECAFLSLIKDPGDPIVLPAGTEPRPIEIRRDNQRIRFPDAVVVLNSAADSTIHHEIRRTLAAAKFSKTVGEGSVSYAGPVLISATSSADKDTRVVWRAANILYPGRTTDGHDATLFTHSMIVGRPDVTCNPHNTPDFGQNWHCLRLPEPPNSASPDFAVDLPTENRRGQGHMPAFNRYRLFPIAGHDTAQLTWVLQIPPEIVSEHNDIFNPRASSLLISLIQLSGGIMSLAQDWDTTFEGPAN
jgi:hypothetical protein